MKECGTAPCDGGLSYLDGTKAIPLVFYVVMCAVGVGGRGSARIKEQHTVTNSHYQQPEMPTLGVAATKARSIFADLHGEFSGVGGNH